MAVEHEGWWRKLEIWVECYANAGHGMQMDNKRALSNVCRRYITDDTGSFSLCCIRVVSKVFAFLAKRIQLCLNPFLRLFSSSFLCDWFINLYKTRSYMTKDVSIVIEKIKSYHIDRLTLINSFTSFKFLLIRNNDSKFVKI